MTTLIEGQSDPLALLLHQWLQAKKGLSGSSATENRYGHVMKLLRDDMHYNGFDLDGDPESIAQFVQNWVTTPRRIDKKVISANSVKQQLAIISSFYDYAIKHEKLKANPMRRIDYPKVQEYASAEPMDYIEVTRCMKRIDLTGRMGQRDFALLAVAFTTGRRAQELVSMSLGDIAPMGGAWMVRWPRVKGGKVKHDTLEPQVAQALLFWIISWYGPEWRTLPTDTPVWVRVERKIGERLAYHGMRLIFFRRLGANAGRMHASRHSFARYLLKNGASVLEIQERLGHGSLDTTYRYLKSVGGGEGEKRTQVANLIGLGEE